MRILVIGATGALGTPLVRALLERGHVVHGSATSRAKARTLTSIGALPEQINVFDHTDVSRVINTIRADAVINVATRIPPLSRAGFPWAWRQNHRLRRTASHVIARAAAMGAVHTFIQEAVSFGYADAGDEWIVESSPTRFRGAVATVPHAVSAAQVMERSDKRGVALLFGRFYGDDPMTRETFERVRAGKPVLLGTPAQWTSMVHFDSAVAAVVAALDAPSGAYNVNDPPLTKGELAAALGGVAFGNVAGGEVAGGKVSVGAATFYPEWVSKVSPGAEVLSRSQRVSTAKFEAATGWTSSQPDVASALRTAGRGRLR